MTPLLQWRKERKRAAVAVSLLPDSTRTSVAISTLLNLCYRLHRGKTMMIRTSQMNRSGECCWGCIPSFLFFLTQVLFVLFVSFFHIGERDRIRRGCHVLLLYTLLGVLGIVAADRELTTLTTFCFIRCF